MAQCTKIAAVAMAASKSPVQTRWAGRWMLSLRIGARSSGETMSGAFVRQQQQQQRAFSLSALVRSTAPEKNGPPPSAPLPKKLPLTAVLKSKILPLASSPTVKHEHVFNVPNILTFGRLFSSPLIGYLILNNHHTAALSLFAIASFTDLVDGLIARRWNLQTVVGSVIDPMADKTLMTTLTVCLAAQGGLPLWLAVIILGRDCALAISAIYFRYISLPPPKTFARYWDFSLPSAEVHPTTISKLNTALQFGVIGACMANPVLAGMMEATGVEEWQAALEAMQCTVATTTVWSGLSYVFSKDAVKILKHPQVPPPKE